MLNMTWIYRAKKYYQLTEAYIYTLLIPVTYKLHDSDIRKMVTASDEKALEDAVEATYYGRHFLEPESCELVKSCIFSLLAESTEWKSGKIHIRWQCLFLICMRKNRR